MKMGPEGATCTCSVTGEQRNPSSKDCLPVLETMASSEGQIMESSHNTRKINKQGIHTLALPPTVCDS